MKNNTQRICILTGAGISAESGLKTFRDHKGLWENHSVEDVATPQGFRRNRPLVYRFYNERRAQLQEESVQPNAAHFALAELEKKWPGQFLIITQNVDDLHERAGSKNVVHMHGELLKARCNRCGNITEWKTNLDQSSICPACEIVDHMRPHIVWFGEIPNEMEACYNYLKHTDLFVSIGTSGEVYPAAGFCKFAKENQAKTLELNLENSTISSQFDESLQGPAGTLVPKWVEEFLAKNTSN